MSANTVRADYEALTQVGQQFSRQTDATRRTLEQLKRNMDVLQRGDWQGQGADKFYEEMNSAVLPSMQRLVNALDSAGHRTQDISRIMQEAEDEAANVLRGLGGVAPGSAAAFVQADRGPRRNRRTPAKDTSKGPTIYDMFAQLADPRLKDIPGSTLFVEIAILERAGWQITKGAGNTYSLDAKRITVDSDGSVQSQLHIISAAYAENTIPPVDLQNMDREEYVQAASARQMDVEGVRIFEEYQVMNDLKSLKGPAIDFAPITPPKTPRSRYDDIYASYVKGDIDEVHAQTAMGNLVIEEQRFDYMKRFGDQWDFKNIEMH